MVNDTGKVIASLNPGKKKGINIVTWDGTIKSPKQPKGITIVRAFGGPRVLPGTYKVIINKGKDRYEGSMTYQLDPKSPHSLADKKANYDLSMNLYNSTEQLAYFVYEFDAYKAYVDSNGTKLPNNKGVKKLRADLDSLKDKLVVTKGDNYVGTAEPRLRERMGDLYGQVSGYYGKPGSNEINSAATLNATFAQLKAQFETLKAAAATKPIPDMVKAGAPPMAPPKSFDEFVAEK